MKQKLKLFLFFGIVSFFVFTSHAKAQEPKVFFSDMQDGVASGFDGSMTRGAAISIWGLNFGATRGSSYVSVGGVDLTNDTDYAEWGATENPKTARGLERTTFYLNSSMAKDGVAPNTSITVTNSDGTSVAIPFHIRSAGNIYFVSTTGNDLADGLTTLTPWLSLAKARNNMHSGDVVYVRSGTYISEDAQVIGPNKSVMEFYASDTNNYHSGTAWNSIGVSSYPTEKVTLGDYTGATTNTIFNFIAGGAVTGLAELNYWTFSKLEMLGYLGNFQWGYNPQHQKNDGFRIIGNDLRTTHAYQGEGISINPYTTSSVEMQILGNYLHDTGVPFPPALAPTVSIGSGTGLTGSYKAKYTFKRDSNDYWQESEMSQESLPIILSNGSLRVNFSSAEYDGDVYTHTCVYRTKAGGDEYFFDQCVPYGTSYLESSTPDNSLSTRSNILPGYKVSGIYFGGGTDSYLNVGWNEFVRNNGTALQVYGHFCTDKMLLAKVHDNFIHNNGRQSLTLGGGDPAGTCNYTYLKQADVYNNIIAGDKNETFRITGLNDDGLGGTLNHETEGIFNIYNNTIYKNQLANDVVLWHVNVGDSKFSNNILVGSTGSAQFESTMFNHLPNYITGDHNIVTDVIGALPAWMTNNQIGVNPGFISSNPVMHSDFRLEASSLAIGSGVEVPMVSSDFLGTPRDSFYDIGAFEYSSGDTTAPNSPSGLNVL